MDCSATHRTGADTDTDFESIRERIREMTEISDDALAERDIAMRHARLHGIPDREIGRCADLTPDQVHAAVTAIADDDTPYNEAATWVRFFRHTGFR